MRGWTIICSCIVLFFITINLDATVYAKEESVFDSINEEQEENPKKEDIEEANDVVAEFDGKRTATNIGKALFALILIVVLIYIVLNLLNRNKVFQKHKVINTFGGVSLGPNKSIQIIRIGEQFYLVGVADTIQLLDQIEDPLVIDQLLQENDEHHSAFGSTVNQMKQLFPSRKRKEKDFKNLFQQELNQMKQNQARSDFEERNKENE